MPFFKPNFFFDFTRAQRVGILVLCGLIIALQTIYYTVNFQSNDNEKMVKEVWLPIQNQTDSSSTKSTYKKKIYPFNPNFITDFKGYQLGMSTAEIDRLLAFRKQKKFVNSAKEFQEVTKVSDSLLKVISTNFKFPDWVNNKSNAALNYKNGTFEKKGKLPILDINQATKEDLMKVNGIGNALSERILKQKEVFGGFVSMEQMSDIWGLSPEVIEKLQTNFVVKNIPNINKIAINKASLKELSQFYYFKYPLVKAIVTYRSMNGMIKIEDLSKINGFPLEKIKIIALYLEF